MKVVWSLFDVNTATCAKALSGKYFVYSFGLKGISGGKEKHIENGEERRGEERKTSFA